MDSGIYYLWKVIYSQIVYSTIHVECLFILHYPYIVLHYISAIHE